MSNIRPYPLSDSNASYMSKLGTTLNSHNITAGKGLNINKTSDGIQLSINNSKRDINYLMNVGVYNFSNEYWPNQIVYVDPAKNYVDQNNNPLTIAAGSYVCINHVPPANNSSTFFTNIVVPAYQQAGGYPTDVEANCYRWYNCNNYVPTSSYNNPYQNSVQNGFNIVTSQSFWQPITPPVSNPAISLYDTSGGTAYNGGNIVYVPNQFTLNGVNVLPGTYGLISGLSTPTNPTGNQVPQIPAPSSGTIYWVPIAAGMVAASSCATGTTQTIYINSTGLI